MGNSKSCSDGCGRTVPKGVTCFHLILFRSHGRANGLYSFFERNTWIKLKDDRGNDSGYLCPYCLDRRVRQQRREEQRKREREEEEEEQRKRDQQRRREEQQRRKEEQRKWEEQQRRKEEQRKWEEHQRRKEEQRKWEEQQRRKEEQRKWEEQQRRKEEQRKWEEQQRRKEEQRKWEEQQRRKEEQRKWEEQQRRKEEQRKWEQQRRKEEQRKWEEQQRRKEEQRKREEQQRRKEEQRKWEEQQRRKEEQRKWEEQQRRIAKQREREEEQRRIEEQREREEEQRRIAEQREREEQQRRKEEQRKREKQQRRIAEQREREEQQRRKEEQREREEQQRRIEEQREREEEQRRIEEQREREEEQRRIAEQRKREEEKRKREEEFDQPLNSYIAKQKKESLEHSAHQVLLTNAFDDSTNAPIMESDSFHETITAEGKNADDDDYGIRARQQGASYRSNVWQQKGEQATRGKSVEDITQEIKDLSPSDSYKINEVLRKVFNQIPGSNWRKPGPEELHNILEADYYHRQIVNCIAAIRQEVKNTKGYLPRDTQLVSLCLLIKSLQEGRLLEIKTGEGKSCIVAMFAVFLVLTGRSVDIVTSSPILAVRDVVEWSDFYKKFNIQVECNLIPKENEDRLKCYKKPVVYGTVGSFASDILRQEFLMEDVRGDRKFDAVIVDEVDSMLLDQGVNFTYLSSPAPGMHHIQPILLMIWNEVICHPVVRSDLGQNYFVGKPEPFHVVLLKDIDLPGAGTESLHNPLDILSLLEEKGVLRNGFADDVQEEVLIDQNEKSLFSKEMNKKKMFECLQWVEYKYHISIEMFEMYDESTIHKVNKDHDGKQADLRLLIVGKGLVCVLYQDKKALCDLIRTKIEIFLTTGCQKEEECRYEFPSYLSEFVGNRLPQWIDNAFLAISMKEGREYLIKDQEIVPVDFESTGVVELNTKWGDGLHQFLELKHQKKLSPMTLVTNFMSNQAFFKRYPGKLFGLSGTLGSESELAFLQEHYDLSYTRIPTYLHKKFSEFTGIVCSNKAEWLQCIGKEVKAHTSNGKRAVLIICEDINTAKEVKESLATLTFNSVTLFTENEGKKNISGKKLTGGDVIIATNIAGRGTDIEIDESVVKTGGLFVLVTFLPSNSRVENQVFGRCARKGQPGSAQLVINKESLPLYLKIEPFSDIGKLKKIREENAERRQKDNEAALSSSTIPKEDLFSFYCQFISEAAMVLKKESEIERKILLSSMHEFWGLWLKMYCENLDKNTFKEFKQRLNKALQKAKRQVMDKTSPCANLYHIIKLANERLLKNKFKEFEEAEKLYTKAIETDKTWAAIAYYNRAYCRLLQRKDGYMDAAISDLNEAKKGLRKYIDEVALFITLLSILPKGTESADKSTTTMMSQFETRGQILNFYEENIDKALKKLDESKKEKKGAKAVGHNALTIALGDDKYCKKLDSELLVFWDLGLTEIFSIEEECGFNWKASLVATLGMVQIAVGAFVAVCSSGVLATVGWSLVTEGIKDIWTSARAIYKGDQNFVKKWMKGKAASIAISIVAFGFGQVKSAVEAGNQGFTTVLNAIKKQIETFGKKIWESAKGIPQQVLSASSSTLIKETCKEVGVHVFEESATLGGKYFLESVNKKLKTNFEEKIEKELHKAMTSQGEFKDSLEKFIIIQLQFGREKEEISDTFMKMHIALLESEQIGKVRAILCEWVSGLLKVAKNEMENSGPGVFKELTSQILDFIDNCQKRSSVDVEHLVSVYCQEVDKALKEMYASKFSDIPKRDLQGQAKIISDVKLFIASKIQNHLLQCVRNSFKCTIGGLDIEKLQNTVDGIVSSFSDDNGIGKGILQNIFSISNSNSDDETKKKEWSMVTDVIKVFRSKDGETIHDALNQAKKGLLATLPQEQKKKVGDLYDAFQGGVKALQSKDGLTMDKIGDLARKGLELLPDEEKKKVLALGDTLQGVAQLSKDGTMGLNMDSFMDLARKGTEMLPDEEKKKAGNSLDAFQGGIKALQSKDGLTMIKKGLDVLPDDEKKKAGDLLDSFERFSQKFTN